MTPTTPTPADRTTAIIGLVTVMLPSVVSLARDLFAKANPDQPVPTDAEVKALFASTCLQSLAVDDAWLAAHPPA